MRGSRRRVGAVVALAALAITTAAACRHPVWPPGGGPGGGPSRTITFDTSGAHTWTVPHGVRFATVDVYGAEGGGAEPGQGGRVRATIPVEPGQTLTLVVGAAGGEPAGQTAGAGGFGGGAPGGSGGDPLIPPPEYPGGLPAGLGGAGGGGASDVRTGPADDSGLPTRIVVAGGGGGAAGVAGGDGGADGLAGADGSLTSDPPGWEFPSDAVPGGVPGGGTAGTGRPGEDGPDARVEFPTGRPVGVWEGDGGGGGGGGLVGGGGGRSATSGQTGALRWTGISAGGAGGSSLVPSDDVCPVVVEDGVRAGDGQIVVTFRRGASPARACL